MAAPEDAELPQVAAEALKPYASLMVLRSTAPNHELAVRTLSDEMAHAACKMRTGIRSEVVASGIAGADGYLRPDGDDEGIDDVWAFVYRKVQEPGWSLNSSVFIDTRHQLGVVIRRNDLICVHCPCTLRTSLQKWLNRSPRPPLERVKPAILNGAFLRGEARGLWLKGAQTPTRSRPDSKTVTGRGVQDSLSPFEDGGFALSSARAAFDCSPRQRALKGTVGTTPRDSIVWNRPTDSFDEFVALATDVLTLVEDTAASGGGVDQPYQVLAQPVTSLIGVSGAFDIGVASVESLPLAPDIDDDVVDAIATLEEATLVVVPVPGSPDFRLEVGLHNGTAGTLLCSVAEDGSDFRFRIGFDPTGSLTNGVTTREILDALHVCSEQIRVYYDSGHVLDGRSIWRRQIRTEPFPNWIFEDFTGYDICKEKPLNGSASEIHAAIAKEGDTSLFAWVVSHHSEGWLICDDGSGEVADFVHLGLNGDLSFIHVKRAGQGRRQISVVPYEEVVSQATKNLSHLDQDALHRALDSSSLETSACWTNGQRVADRSEFLEQLGKRSGRAKKRVVVVQPHVSKAIYSAIAMSSEAAPNTNSYRLGLLETLLNANRMPVTGLGSDLYVIGSRA